MQPHVATGSQRTSEATTLAALVQDLRRCARELDGRHKTTVLLGLARQLEEVQTLDRSGIWARRVTGFLEEFLETHGRPPRTLPVSRVAPSAGPRPMPLRQRPLPFPDPL